MATSWRCENLHVEFHTDDGIARAINGVDLHLDQGETLAILGESGSGKSVTAQAVMGILDMPPATIPEGKILLPGSRPAHHEADRTPKDPGTRDLDHLPGRPVLA